MNERKVIHFAHGNGFPSLSYRKMLNVLKEKHDVFFIEKIGHDNDYPITDNWTFLVDELISSIESQSNDPVVAVGHSMGGILSLMACVKRPELFEAVITLDAYIVGKMTLAMLYLAKHMGQIEKLTPAGRTKNRRIHWESKEAVKNYFSSKAFFKNFDPVCFDDYIEYGTKKDKDGYYLAFDREREYQMYCTIPHRFALFNQKNKVPWALVYGEQSEYMNTKNITAARNLYHMHCEGIKGSHMFPLEYPIESANRIQKVIENML